MRLGHRGARRPTGRRGAGVVRTARGEIRTPVFMPVGDPRHHPGAHHRRARRSCARPTARGPRWCSANTYHLMLRPGAETVAELGGLHRFTGWDGHMLTDSGGYQVFSLDPKVHRRGAEFRSTYDGDQPPAHPGGRGRHPGAARRRHPDGARRVRRRCRRTGGCCATPSSAPPRGRPGPGRPTDGPTTRRCSASCRAATDAATCGSSRPAAPWRSTSTATPSAGCRWGRPASVMLPALDAALAELPADQPRYLMGVGDPVSIVEAVALGVDMFDCVLPTRLARHGTLLTDHGRLNIKRAEFAPATTRSTADCPCTTCRRLQPRLPAPPGAPGRAGRGHAVHGAQPDVDARPSWAASARRSPPARSTRSGPRSQRSGRRDRPGPTLSGRSGPRA